MFVIFSIGNEYIFKQKLRKAERLCATLLKFKLSYMKISDFLIIFVLSYSVLIFLFPLFFYRRNRQFIGQPFFSFLFVNSLSLREIVLLSFSKSDRTSFIKDYYDFKHKNISSMIKGISSVIILNLSVIIKNHFDKSLDPKDYNPNDVWLVVLTSILIIINVRHIIKLNECIREFNLTVKIYELLK